ARVSRLFARARHRWFHGHAGDHLLHRSTARRESQRRGNDTRQPRLGEQDNELRCFQAPSRVSLMSLLLLKVLSNSASRDPGACAIVWRNTKWSYADLACAAARVSNVLAMRPMQAGARIGLLMRNSPQYVACFYGVLGAGGATVALNSQERASVLARQLQHSGAELVIVDRDHVEFEPLRQLANEHGIEVLPVTLGDDQHSQAQFASEFGDTEREWISAAREDLAMIIYTSGTTGRPKGVMISHGNLAANTAAIVAYLGLHPADR